MRSRTPDRSRAIRAAPAGRQITAKTPRMGPQPAEHPNRSNVDLTVTDVDRRWQAFLRRFDNEHTLRRPVLRRWTLHVHRACTIGQSGYTTRSIVTRDSTRLITSE